LVEVLVVMAGLSVAVMFGTVLILTTLKTEQTAEAAADRVSRRQELARQFRDDVAQAESAPDKLGDLTAGPACLILRTPSGSAVVYQWQKEDGVLERIQRIGDKETHKQIPIGLKETGVEFVRPGELGVFTLRISEQPKNGPARRSDLSAALGGNLR
jgi:hypothetical protein